ncbi:MAG TPA: two-component regulator propeller domain-containing protein [Candidatus Krumholzibacteria bacterium]|nr:two-component regulator propeller domain-containing protein [Candidatus Krumholzibacteria bacterium]HPD72523.1 two-component regulator propeller domain-containing protein [Candidatus Krumholzibacteria bacterium]HRY40545.1 two-component regulator propeller domain-containing protein [Candidatus Krumholzibacteria bacterium]
MTRERLSIAVCAFLALASGALGLPADRRPSQYVHDRWDKEDGLPLDMVGAVQQTSDGYLWLATQQGVARYDGLAFTVYDALSTPAYPHKQAETVFAQGDSLWIGGSNGVALLHDGRVECWNRGETAPAAPVQILAATSDGRVYAGTTNGLAQLIGGRFSLLDQQDPVLGSEVRALACDGAGRVWVGTRGGLAIIGPAGVTTHGDGPWLTPEGVLGLAQGRDGRMWVATAVGLWRTEGGLLVRVEIRGDPYPGGMIWSIMEDSQGVLWICAENRGLFRLLGGQLESVTDDGGLVDAITAYEDPQGTLWIGSFGSGLHRFRAGPFVSWAEAEGLSGDAVRVVCAAHDGGVWISTYGAGLDHLRDGVLTRYGVAEGVPPGNVGALMEDRRGRLWVGVSEGIAVLEEDGRFHPVKVPENLAYGGVRSMLEDSRGNLWFGTRMQGVFRISPTGVRQFTSADGLSSEVARGGLLELDDGAILVGTDGGVNVIRGDRVEVLGPAQGVPEGLILCMYRDSRGDVWIGGPGAGLVRLRGGRGQVFGLKDGLIDDALFGFLEDESGRLWVASNSGVFSFHRESFDRFASGEKATISCRLYGRGDGLKNSECNGGCTPAVAADRSGVLWFATNGGVAAVDPRLVAERPPSPPVLLQEASLSGAPYPVDQPVQVRPGSGDLVFTYTAIALNEAEEVRFRYMLEGYDEEWTQAGTRRQAIYTNIPPGDYRFRVQVTDLGGQVGRAETTLSFRLQPYFYQSVWFYAAVLFSGGVLLVGVLVQRERRRLLRERELEAQVTARTRELQEAKELAEAANRSRGEFLANMSHEIRTPLNAVMGMTELVLETDLDADQRECLATVQSSGRTLLALINDILDFSKIDAGRLELEQAPFSLRQCVDRTLALLRVKAEARGLDLQGSVDDVCPDGLVGDAVRLQQVLVNLLGNALKFTERGRVTLRVTPAAGPFWRAGDLARLHLAVADTGIGIPPAKQKVIFEAFRQADGSTTRRFGGTGLGLSISASLVRLMGGELSVTSREGEGSTFYFEAAFALAAESGVPEREVATSAAAGHASWKVLVAEDNPVNQKVIRLVLERLGHQVVVVGDGREALERSADPSIDLVLMDLQMPVMDGLEATTAIRAREAAGGGRRLPVVALTARAMRDDTQACQAAGMDGFVAKPVARDQLVAAMAAAMAGEPQVA